MRGDSHGRTVQNVPKRSIDLTEILYRCCTQLMKMVPVQPVKKVMRPSADASSVLNWMVL